ncbi:hypothetical protein AKJ42_00740 [candidate division MSBL1 archaeon SCGC-AAA261C02]|uniref:PIN domain-containing protein n=1 Tax=candidate division MSBL1 archaeon SCGC-AAA261C02 TaxID=1698272 RepID=A0A133V1W3_9EURY|nr:hypothetical protein AKJ42_00740 [candidate division MSBL1 archaeon SCGC-AAA261C02]
MLVFDAYAWIEYFLGSNEGKIVKDHLEEKENILTPEIILAEIARKYLREGVSEHKINQRLRFIIARSETEGVDADLSLKAAKAWRKLSESAKGKELGAVGLTDGILLALAQEHDARIVTGDPHFEDLKEVIMLGGRSEEL